VACRRKVIPFRNSKQAETYSEPGFATGKQIAAIFYSRKVNPAITGSVIFETEQKTKSWF
jgi:hypothetical protein